MLVRFLDRLPSPVADWLRLGGRAIRDAKDDRLPGLSAEIAFWVLLSLPSMLLAVVAAAGLIGAGTGQNLRGGLVERIEELALQVFTTDTVQATIAPTLDGLVEGGTPSLVSVSFLITIYTASRVLRVVVHAVTMAYDLEDQRPTWIARFIGFGFTLAGLALAPIVVPLLIAGPELGSIVQEWLPVNLFLTEIWHFVYWPISLISVALLLSVLYHFATPWSTPFRREFPGAILATLLGLMTSVGLRTYTSFAFDRAPVYAALAAPLAILVWVWLQGIALLVGAELNAEVERTYPTGRPLPTQVDITEARGWAAARLRKVTDRRKIPLEAKSSAGD